LEQNRLRVLAIFQTTTRRGEAFRLVAQEFGVTPDDVKRYYYRHLHQRLKNVGEHSDAVIVAGLDQLRALFDERDKALQRVQEINFEISHHVEVLAQQVIKLTEEKQLLQQKLVNVQNELVGAEKFMQRIQDAMSRMNAT